jgi:hypothetical protein
MTVSAIFSKLALLRKKESRRREKRRIKSTVNGIKNDLLIL